MRALITVVAIVVAIAALILFVQNEPNSDTAVTSATSEDLAAPTATIGLMRGLLTRILNLATGSPTGARMKNSGSHPYSK